MLTLELQPFRSQVKEMHFAAREFHNQTMQGKKINMA